VNIICLLDNPEVVVASGKRVFSADETGALLSIADSADRLQMSVKEEEDRIQQAENRACERGRNEGMAQGRQTALAELAETKLSLVDQTNAELSQMREEVLSLALQVVRKIADGVDTEDMLFALATTAAEECLPSKSIVLKVHPDSVDGVKARLSEYQSTSETNHPIHSIVADEDLDLDACVLETDAGQVCADLDTQLSVLEKHLAATAPAVKPAEATVDDSATTVKVDEAILAEDTVPAKNTSSTQITAAVDTATVEVE